MEDQTIEDIDKVEKTTPEKDSNLTEVIYLNHLKSNSGGLIDKNNLLQGIPVMST